jgi:hypothetical protein
MSDVMIFLSYRRGLPLMSNRGSSTDPLRDFIEGNVGQTEGHISVDDRVCVNFEGP